MIDNINETINGATNCVVIERHAAYTIGICIVYGIFI